MTLISGTPIRLVNVFIYAALLMSFIGILLSAAIAIPQKRKYVETAASEGQASKRAICDPRMTQPNADFKPANPKGSITVVS